MKQLTEPGFKTVCVTIEPGNVLMIDVLDLRMVNMADQPLYVRLKRKSLTISRRPPAKYGIKSEAQQ